MGRHVLLTVLALGLLAPAAAQAQTPLGQNCQARDGIRFCEGSTGSRVPTFDGVPLDVNVALPPTGTGPFPLIIQLHGYGGSKTPGTPGTAVFDRDYKAFALDGYAVLNYSARGFGNSCGSPASRLAAPAACARGNIKLADSRFEVRDSQHLAGLLVDQGIADPGRIGAMGGSYGGGQSLALAVLKDRIRLPDGSFEAWRSPNGTPLSIAAAAPFIPWSDLVYSLVPNGRTLDYTLTQPTDDLDPSGTMKLSFVTGLYAAGQATGFYAPPGTDPTADLNTWYPRILAGDPYDGDPVVAQIISQIAGFKSPFYLPMDRAPAPIFISNGFTDDLFPVDEAVRMVNKIEAAHPEVPVAQLHFDYGHMRGQTKPADLAVLTDFRRRFLARHVKGDGAVTPPTGVTALTRRRGSSCTPVRSVAAAGPRRPSPRTRGTRRSRAPSTPSPVAAPAPPPRAATSRAWRPIASRRSPTATRCSARRR
jgi:acetyl esterase/lipase